MKHYNNPSVVKQCTMYAYILYDILLLCIKHIIQYKKYSEEKETTRVNKSFC